MKIFITGGCKNGKSTFALSQAVRLAGDGERWYIATMSPRDDEERRCVRNHRAAREGLNFATYECPQGIPACPPGADPDGTFLLDSVTALLANEMYAADGTVDAGAVERITGDLGRFLATVRNAVIVSDYIYADGCEYSDSSREFIKGLAELDRFLARSCDCVVEICSGIAAVHKGSLEEKGETALCI